MSKNLENLAVLVKYLSDNLDQNYHQHHPEATEICMQSLQMIFQDHPRLRKKFPDTIKIMLAIDTEALKEAQLP
ncbi:MAG TPA: hypothetical protein VF817_03975 [Patescibacteria group bacterium]